MRERIVDTTVAAEILVVSPDTVRRWCEDGVFPNAYPIGTKDRRYWRIPVSDLSVIRTLPAPPGLEGGTR